jgi:type II secretory pathway pseudopilin PulG
MYLEGQGNQRGYAMAALLVAVAVMAVLMSVALPAWRHQAQREKEAELVFRGEQWVRAIQQYQRKNGPGVYPPSLDVLVQQRFVRKKWKDPITGEDFVPWMMGQQTQPGPGGRQGGPTPPQPPTFGGQPVGGGGIMGVRSKSTATSIMEYKGATRYDQWQFLAGNIGGAPGGPGGPPMPGGPGIGGPGRGGPGRGGPGAGGPGRGGPGRGGPQTQPPGRGGSPFPLPPGGRGRGGD